MTRTWITTLVVAAGSAFTMAGQPYPPSYPPQNPGYQNYPNDGYYDDEPPYYDPGVYAPAPPPVPRYAYGRPPIPGPGYFWVDGYWNFIGNRYVWVNGYWTVPPYANGYWVAPRYNAGRFFVGFWGGGPRGVRGGVVVNGYRGPVGRGYGYYGGQGRYSRGPRYEGHGYREGRR